MSNKTQLQTNNTKYASLIETLRGKTLPGGDSGDSGSSGGNIETCTLELSSDIGFNAVVYSTVNSDGKIIWERRIQPQASISLTVVCGTLVQVVCTTDSNVVLSNASAVDISGTTFAIEANSGEIATATFTMMI